MADTSIFTGGDQTPVSREDALARLREQLGLGSSLATTVSGIAAPRQAVREVGDARQATAPAGFDTGFSTAGAGVTTAKAVSPANQALAKAEEATSLNAADVLSFSSPLGAAALVGKVFAGRAVSTEKKGRVAAQRAKTPQQRRGLAPSPPVEQTLVGNIVNAVFSVPDKGDSSGTGDASRSGPGDVGAAELGRDISRGFAEGRGGGGSGGGTSGGGGGGSAGQHGGRK
jgi:hypothetical protein